jgi:hypothetical protein
VRGGRGQGAGSRGVVGIAQIILKMTEFPENSSVYLSRLGFLALKFISRWVVGLRDIGVSCQFSRYYFLAG